MVTLAPSTLRAASRRGFVRVVRYLDDLLTGLDEARAIALLYQELAVLSDRELSARGLEREDIPRAVLALARGAWPPAAAGGMRSAPGRAAPPRWPTRAGPSPR